MLTLDAHKYILNGLFTVHCFLREQNFVVTRESPKTTKNFIPENFLPYGSMLVKYLDIRLILLC